MSHAQSPKISQKKLEIYFIEIDELKLRMVYQMKNF